MTILIAGGGIGGLATALSLHQKGIECEVFERSGEIRELGVGINTLPHAIKELADLGLLKALDRVAIRTYELIYQNRLGQEIWRDLRGLHAGFDYPQFSVRRGKLQGVLHRAAEERIGADRIHAAHELVDFAQDDDGVTATFAVRDGNTEEVRGDALIAADHWPNFAAVGAHLLSGGGARLVLTQRVPLSVRAAQKRHLGWLARALYPRADVLGAAAERLFPEAAANPTYRAARELEDVVLRVLAELKPSRPLQTNVEFYTALLLHGIGLESSLFTPTSAVARVAGWTAHVLEQYANNRLIRPRANWVGPDDRAYLPLDQR